MNNSAGKILDTLAAARIAMPDLFLNNNIIPKDRESANKITYIGFSSSSNNDTSVKCYFRPDKDILRLEPFAQKDKVAVYDIVRIALSIGVEPFEYSIASLNGSSSSLRLLWRVPSKIRSNEANMSLLLRSIAELMGFPQVFSAAREISYKLKDILGVRLNPLYLIGGQLDSRGHFLKMKVDFDADIGEDVSLYDNKKSLIGFDILLNELVGAKSYYKWLIWKKYVCMLLKNGYYIHFWGSHFVDIGLTEVKLYLRKNEYPSKQDCELLERLMSECGCRALYPVSHMADFFKAAGWGYYGFYIGLSSEDLITMKTYFSSDGRGICLPRN